MGSAAGRRKCCEFFFVRGYQAGRADTVSQWDNFLADEKALMYAASTVSKSFCGLFRNGYAMGLLDKDKGPRAHAYYDYKVSKADGHDILNLMDQGFILRYEPTTGWPNHPFTLSSQPGGIVYRRSSADWALAQDADYYKHHKVLRDVMAEAIDDGFFAREKAHGKA